ARRAPPEDDLEGFGSDETEFDLAGEDLEDDEEENRARRSYRPVESSDEEFAAIDLSPIVPGKEHARPSSVIGGDARQKSGGRHRSGKKRARNQQRRGKPQGRAGERRRGRQ